MPGVVPANRFHGKAEAPLHRPAVGRTLDHFHRKGINPPYFLSNGCITCKAGKMVSIHKGDWDKSRSEEEEPQLQPDVAGALPARAQTKRHDLGDRHPFQVERGVWAVK